MADVVELCVKALDRDGNTQPERVGSIWNFRGIYNKYVSHRWNTQQVHKREIKDSAHQIDRVHRVHLLPLHLTVMMLTQR